VNGGTYKHKARSVAADGGAASDSKSDEHHKSAEADQQVHEQREQVGVLLTTRQDPGQPLLVKERPQTNGQNPGSRQLNIAPVSPSTS